MEEIGAEDRTRGSLQARDDGAAGPPEPSLAT